MNNDIVPPKRPLNTKATPLQRVQPALEAPPEPVLLEDHNQAPQKKRRSVKKIIVLIFLGLVGLMVAAGVAGWMWYQSSLSAVQPGSKTRTRIQVVEGSSPTQIGQLLEEKGVIKSGLAFDIYTRLSNTRSKLQAGTYSLSPSEPMAKTVDHLVAGRVDQITITFFPGATLSDESDTPADKKSGVRTVLLQAGYQEAEIDAALSKTYDHPLFATKPANTTLEGYIYGETYAFDSSATVEQVLTKTFDEYYKQIVDNDLVNRFKKQGLTLYEGITLASIIQREVPGSEDQKKVAQVFFKRLKMDMELGSDVTYQYAAKQLGVAPTPELSSPYNTRKVKGLPPGPIASPGLSALQAVAAPAKGNNLYFLSGDVDITYFGKTDEEHEANIRNHCKIKCSVF